MSERNQNPKRVIKEQIENLKEMWASGAFSGNTLEHSMIMNTEAVGIVKGLNFALIILEENLVEDD